MPKNPDEIGALWQKEKNGKIYFTVIVNDVKVVIFPNDRKQTEKQPDYRVLISRPRPAQSECLRRKYCSTDCATK